MPNKRFSDLTQPASLAGLWLPAFDNTRSPGDENLKISVSALLSGVGDGSAPITTTVTGINIAVGDVYQTQLNQPISPTADIAVLGLTLQSPSIAAPLYNLLIYQGEPGNGGKILYNFASVHKGQPVGSDNQKTYDHPNLIYLPASGGSNTLWVRIINVDQNPIKNMAAQTVSIEFNGQGAQLPVWVDPPPYTGPLLDVVQVGPSRQFIEPRFGLQALADGGTMIVDPGVYYYPFGVSWNPAWNAPNHRLKHGYNPNHPLGAARFINGITIQGAGTYTTLPTIFHGRGGIGLIPDEDPPFRLLHGQGFVWAESPVTVKDIRFMWCGGYDCNSDGEAGVYGLNFQSPGTIHLIRCAFDANENGIFTQYWNVQGTAQDETNCTGNSRLLTVTIEDCDFGYLLPNGGGGDGFSQDFYINCMTCNVINCNFYGPLTDWAAWHAAPPMRAANDGLSFQGGHDSGYLQSPPTSGNSMKSRSRYFNVDGCWARNHSGKWIDRPDGGTCIVNNGTFTTLEPTSTSLAMGYNTERISGIPLSSPVFTNCSFYMNRSESFGSIWWIQGSSGRAGWPPTPATYRFDCSDPSNHIYFGHPGAGLIVNRTNSTWAHDATAIAGMTDDYVVRTDDGNMGPGPHPLAYTATPPPASINYAAGAEQDPDLGPLVP